MKRAIAIAAGLSAAGLLTTPAMAQGLSSHDITFQPDRGSQAFAFLRIPLGGPVEQQQPNIGIGFGLADRCFGSVGFDAQSRHDACEASPFRSIEISGGLNDAPWTLSFGGASRRSPLASWSPQTGALSLAGEGEGSGNWLWIGLGVAAGVGVVAVLTQDDDPLMCTGNTIPNPIAGTCEPLVIN